MIFTVERGGSESVDAIMETMAEAASANERKEWFVADSRDEVARRIGVGAGFALLARAGGTMAGFLVVDVPGPEPRNLGWDLGWPEAEVVRSAHIDTVCVRPPYRGHGLQKTMMRAAETELAGMGILHSLATVHPDNAASLFSVLALGYAIKATKPKYGGLPRHILCKEISAAPD